MPHLAFSLRVIANLLEDTAAKYGVPFNISRGYASLSNLRDVCEMAKKFGEKSGKTKHTCLYVGDHDPSGLDMEVAFKKYAIYGMTIEPTRVAITHEQARHYPALRVKMGDPRAKSYIGRFGDVCWEVEAIPPGELVEIIDEAIRTRCDMGRLEDSKKRDEEARNRFVFQT